MYRQTNSKRMMACIAVMIIALYVKILLVLVVVAIVVVIITVSVIVGTYTEYDNSIQQVFLLSLPGKTIWNEKKKFKKFYNLHNHTYLNINVDVYTRKVR